MPRGNLQVARSVMLLGIVVLSALLGSERAGAADTLKVGDEVTTKKAWVDIWETPTTKGYVARSQCSLPVKVERASSPWIFVRLGGKSGWVRMADFELAEKKTESKQRWDASSDSSSWGAELDTAWPPAPSPLLAYADADPPSGGKSKAKTPKAPAANTVAMPAGPIQIGDKVMPRDLTVALKYRAKFDGKIAKRARRPANGSHHCQRGESATTKTVATAADIAWPVEVRQIKGDWLWIDETEDRQARGWVRRADVMTMVDAPLYYTMRIMAAATPREAAPHYLLRAKCRIEQNHKDSALEDLTKAIEAQPTFKHYLARGRAYCGFDNKDFDGGQLALDDADRALQLQPQSAAAHALRARALLLLDRADDAFVELDRAISLDPREEKALFLRGVMRLLVRRDRSGALTDWNRVIELIPSTACLSARACDAIEHGEFARAQRDVEQALRRDPDDVMTLCLQSHVHAALSSPLPELEKSSLTGQELSAISMYRGFVLFKYGHVAEALQELDDSHISGAEPRAMAHCFRASMLMSRHREANALAELDRALYHAPEFHMARILRIMFLCRMNCQRRAIDEVTAAIDVAPEAAWRAGLLLWRARLKVEFYSDFEGGLADCDLALASDADSGAAHQQRAAILLAMGQPEVAIREADLAVAKLDSPTTPNESAGMLQLQDGHFMFRFGCRFDIPSASEPDALEKNPNSELIMALIARGKARFDLRQCAEAREDFERAVELNTRCAAAWAALADFIARCRDNPRGAGGMAMTAGREACLHGEHKSAASLQALAAAYAAEGNHPAACYWEELVRDFAPNKFVRTEAEDRLACYRQGRIATPEELLALREARDITSHH